MANIRAKKENYLIVFLCMLISFVSVVSYLNMVSSAVITKDSVFNQPATPKLERTLEKNSLNSPIAKKVQEESLKLVTNSNQIKSFPLSEPQKKEEENKRPQQILMRDKDTQIKSEPLSSQNNNNNNNNLRGSINTEPILLSLGKPATADVKGNLGSPDVVTNENVENWLEDRWQAAKDMTGKPIPGEHWLEIDLQRTCIITRLFIDWEIAYSNDYTIVGRAYKDSLDDMGTPIAEEYWVELGKGSNARSLGTDKKHVIHDISVHKHVFIYPLKHKLRKIKTDTSKGESLSLISLPPIRFVRLIIHNPSTEWGSSVWRFQVYGIPQKP